MNSRREGRLGLRPRAAEVWRHKATAHQPCDEDTTTIRWGRFAWVGVVALCLSVSTAVAQPSVVGEFSLVQPLPFFPVHLAVVPPHGKVMIWPGDLGISGNDPRLWDPATGTTSLLAKPGYDLFCAGHSFLANGHLFVTGGHIQNNRGLPNASIYDPFADAWTPVPDMNAGRWYPTNTTLPNGDVLVLSGSISGAEGVNKLPQVFEVGSGTWRDLTNAQLALALYPRMHVAPNGRVFNSSPSRTTRYLDTSGTGTWSLVANRKFGNDRTYGSSVMYDHGKILVMGGANPPTATAEVIDLNAEIPAWRFVGSMAFPRRQLNATLLPDGKILVTGGTSGVGFNNATTPVFAAELWDPVTEAWTTMASGQIPRLYHSSATLLPDGRVLLTGGNNYLDAEVFSPPYLFQGPQPTVTSAPATVGYGQTFEVETPDAADIAQVTWIRLPSVTHAFDQDQRFSRLSFSQAGNLLNVVAPSSPNLAPPGYYMVFILNNAGVPSVAKLVRIVSTTQASLSISNATVTEGNAGTVNAVFTVTLSAASSQTVTVQYATVNGTATAGSDYQAASGMLTFLPGELTKPVPVAVNGDTLAEPSETFFVNLSNPTNATVASGQGLGTIADDDAPAASITVLSPNGGQFWRIGSSKELKWSSVGVSGSLMIELSRDGGATWQVLFASTANDGSQFWTVTGPTTTQARIRITSLSAPVSDTSDGNFRITD